MKQLIEFNKLTNTIAEVSYGGVIVGSVISSSNLYELNILGQQFTTNKKQAVNKCIRSSVETTTYLLEADKRNLPIRISRSTKLIPKGKNCKVIE